MQKLKPAQSAVLTGLTSAYCHSKRCMTRASKAEAAAARDSKPQGSGYWTLQMPAQYEVTISKSHFITLAFPVSSGKDAMKVIADAADATATHNCWAYRCGSNDMRSSDDGEPGGTAGRPILAAIENEGLDYVAVLVIRFYGGVKLGTGGLARAYGGSARDCLKGAPRVFEKEKIVLRVTTAEYSLMGTLNTLVEKGGLERIGEDYDAEGALTLTLSVSIDEHADFIRALADASSGRLVATLVSEGAEAVTSSGDPG